MSTQGRSSDQIQRTPDSDPQTAPKDAGEGTNLLQRWVRLVQSAGLYGNEAGAVRLDELAHGPTTPRIQTLTEIQAARAAAVAEEDAAEAAGSPWWEDAVCAEDEPAQAELPPLYPLPPLVAPPVPPALPAVGEGLLSRILSFGARWLGPVVLGMWPKDTAPPELDQQPYLGPGVGVDPTVAPTTDPKTGCESWTIPHKGGYKFHDWCADTIPGNSIPQHDLFVKPPEERGLTFDAWTRDDNIVWEVKTDQYGKGSDVFNRIRASEQAAKIELQNEVAERCDYGFRVMVTDPTQADLLRELFGGRIEVIYRPGCSG